jgi:succinylarginine dihydrolase
VERGLPRPSDAARRPRPSRRHQLLGSGAGLPVFPRQGRAAIAGGTFHNDVVCVGSLRTLLFHELAFEDTAATKA